MNLPGYELRTWARILAAALLWATPFPARAVLGDTAASVLTDQARMKGTLHSVDRRTYVMHEITTTSPDSLSATNQGQDANGDPVGTAGTVDFTIENADTLFNTNNTAFSTLGGPNPGAFDWGLAFFFGRNIFTAIDQMSTPAGTGPYFAY